jgi:hypothetical protein
MKSNGEMKMASIGENIGVSNNEMAAMIIKQHQSKIVANGNIGENNR